MPLLRFIKKNTHPYDNLHELRADFVTLALPGIEKIELNNNE